jgi:dienelactone hydrolase
MSGGRASLVLAAFLGWVATAPAHAQGRIEIPTRATSGDPATLVAVLSRPEGAGPFPAIVMLHGCGGAYNARGALNLRQKQWERVFLAAGYLVVQIDSFTTRGIKEVCTLRDRPVTSGAGRRRDALAGLAWLQARSDVRADRIAVVGWSHGASTALAAMERRKGDLPDQRFRVAVAFYPGCRVGSDTYKPAGPLLILSGAEDNWTPPASCLAMAERARAGGEDVQVHLYAGAYHDFDWPELRQRTRSGLPRVPGGTVTVGVDEAARADALVRAPEFLARWLRP